MAKKAVKKVGAKKTASKKEVKKAPVKKEAPKKVVVKEAPKTQIVAKKIGKNLIVVIDNKKYTKVNPTESEITSIQTKVLLYNKTKSESKKEELIRLVDKTVAEVEKKIAVKKGIAHVAKKEKKEVKKAEAIQKEIEKDKMALIDELTEKAQEQPLNEEETAKLRKLMKAAGIVEQKTEEKPVVSSYRRSGEH